MPSKNVFPSDAESTTMHISVNSEDLHSDRQHMDMSPGLHFLHKKITFSHDTAHYHITGA